MSGLSEIEWTDYTWNPVGGCSMVSPGCTNCYAMRMAARLQAMGKEKYANTTRKSSGRPVWTGQVNLDHKVLRNPLNWKKPKRIFVNSMSDLFHEGVPAQFIQKVWNIMEKCPQHIFQILTKRPEKMFEQFEVGMISPLPHVWIGTSIESEEYVSRLDILRKTPSYIRFLSLEPLLGPLGPLNLEGIHWVIVGGESGPHARPIQESWVDEIQLSCAHQGVPFFFKQWGGTRKKTTGRMLKGRTWDEYPELVQVACE